MSSRGLRDRVEIHDLQTIVRNSPNVGSKREGDGGLEQWGIGTDLSDPPVDLLVQCRAFASIKFGLRCLPQFHQRRRVGTGVGRPTNALTEYAPWQKDQEIARVSVVGPPEPKRDLALASSILLESRRMRHAVHLDLDADLRKVGLDLLCKQVDLDARDDLS